MDSCTPHMAPLPLATAGLVASKEQSFVPSLQGFCVSVCERESCVSVRECVCVCVYVCVCVCVCVRCECVCAHMLGIIYCQKEVVIIV